MSRKLKKILTIIGIAVFFITVMELTDYKTVQAAEVAIDVDNFPDYDFRNYILQNCDLDNNNILSEEEIAATTSIDLYGKTIYILDGIEYFTALKTLKCNWINLTSLDLSKNIALTELYCNMNELTNLDLSNNTALTKLECGGNELTSLNLSKNTALIELNCSSNKLTNLDLSKNTALIELSCGSNKLTNLDLSKNTALIKLSCDSNKLTNLDLSNNIALEYLSCYFNQLVNLDLSKNTALEYLSCYFNQLANLDLSKSAALKNLDCHSNQLTSLNLSKSTALENLDCYSKLTNLDVSENIALEYLYCYSNQLTDLDVSKNIFLRDLACGENNLTSLDISKNTDLQSLGCDNNKLTELDLSKNTDLQSLGCDNNKLTELDLSKNTDLRSLGCGNNKLTELDLSHNILLGSFEWEGSLSYTGNKLQNIKFSMCLYPYTGLWDYDDVIILDNIKETDYGFIVTDPTKPATYQYSCNGESIKCTLTYVNPYNETISTPISDKHLFNDYEYTNPVSGSSITIYGNGGTFKTGTTKTTNKQFTAYTDITASYIYTLNNKGIVKVSSGKVIAGITKSDAKPVVTKNKIIDVDAAKIARARIKNGQVTVTATGKEGGLVYLWVIDTGNKDVYECCPINVLLAPRKLEIQDKSGNKLKNPKLGNGKTLDICVAGIVSGNTKTNDCTYNATVETNSQGYITVTPSEKSGNKFTITATGFKNNKNTKANIIFQCNENGKKTKFTLTITQ